MRMSADVKTTTSSVSVSTVSITRSASMGHVPTSTLSCQTSGHALLSDPRMAYLSIIVAYSIAQIALGVWVSRRLKGSSDFFVAGRALGPGLLFATFLAANIGSGSTIGATGLGYRDGIAAMWWVGSAGLGSLVLALSVGPR